MSEHSDYFDEMAYDEQKQELKYEEHLRDKDRCGDMQIELHEDEYYSKTIQRDHAKAAHKFLEDNGYAEDWQVVVAEDNMLMLDYDGVFFDGVFFNADPLPDQFYTVLGILEDMLGTASYEESQSKGGNTHVVIYLPVPLPIAERVAWQAAFGSDPKREALHLLSISRGELNPILLFMRKPEQKLLTEGTTDAI